MTPNRPSNIVNQPRMLTLQEQEELRRDLKDTMAILKKLRAQENG